MTMDVRPRRWNRDEYYRMLDAGILTTQDKVQLIEGEIVEMSPQNGPHATAITLATELLIRLASGRAHVRPQLPLALASDSEPEPDLALIAGSPREQRNDDHPATALLVIEVSDSMLRFDRKVKARVYARAGIPEYWIVNVQDRCVEVRRDPTGGESNEEEPTYATVTVYKSGDSIAPLAMPDQTVAVDDLLP